MHSTVVVYPKGDTSKECAPHLFAHGVLDLDFGMHFTRCS